MQKIIFYTISLLVTTFFYAQKKEGIVIDAKTKQPIAYATLQINSNKGTFTNEEGKFTLNIKDYKVTDSLKVSYIGYETISFAIKDIPKVISMEEGVINLDEVNLDQQQLSIEEIIQKANENYLNNYDNFKGIKQRIFVRNSSFSNIKEFKMEIDKAKNYDKKMIQKLNHVIDSIRKPMISNTSISYLDQLFDFYHKNKDTAKVSFVKATLLSNPDTDFSMDAVGEKLKKGFKNLFKDKVFKIKILFFKVEDSLKTKDITKEEKMLLHPAVLSRQMVNLYKKTMYAVDDNLLSEVLNPKLYDYTIAGNLFYNNEFVYEINFSPKKSKSKYQGKLYISDESFAVIKLDFNMLPDKKIEGVNLKWIGLKFKIYDWKGSIEFYQNENGKYVPKYFKQSKKMYNYSKIPLKFIENTKEKNKLKFKLKSKFETVLTQKSEMIFLKNEPLSNSEFKKMKLKKEFPLEKLKKYNPEIWKDYHIIAPTQKLLDYQIE